MISLVKDFVNEFENEISIEIIRDEKGVTIYAKGPNSEVEHTYTPMEAIVLRELLELLEPAYMPRKQKTV